MLNKKYTEDRTHSHILTKSYFVGGGVKKRKVNEKNNNRKR